MTPTVFFGEPSSLTPDQRAISDRWLHLLMEVGCTVDRSRRERYGPDPCRDLLVRLMAAGGVLILGLPQLYVHQATWRPDTDEQEDVVSTWTTPWLHLEVGMAVALGLPVLVAAASGVCEGVFAKDSWVGSLYGTSAEVPDPLVVDEWLAAVGAGFIGEQEHPLRGRGTVLGMPA